MWTFTNHIGPSCFPKRIPYKLAETHGGGPVGIVIPNRLARLKLCPVMPVHRAFTLYMVCEYNVHETLPQLAQVPGNLLSHCLRGNNFFCREHVRYALPHEMLHEGDADLDKGSLS